jgi:hypothetical protein
VRLAHTAAKSAKMGRRNPAPESASSGGAERCDSAMPAFVANLSRARDRWRHAIDISPTRECDGLSGIHFPDHLSFRLRVWRSFGQRGGRRLGVVRLWNAPWQASQFTHVLLSSDRRRGRGRVYSKSGSAAFGKYHVVGRIVSCNATPIPKKGARLLSSKGRAFAYHQRLGLHLTSSTRRR